MDNFTRRFLTEWRRLELPFENETLVTAVSGGADSISLLLVINELRNRNKLKNRFVIAHFNHNLRGMESDQDADFVREICVKFNFEFAYGSGDIPREGNLEQNARFARYAFLKNIAENTGAGTILTAHTLNDQAETFLINLLRGSGIKGLSAMNSVSSCEAEPEAKRDAQRAPTEIPGPESRTGNLKPEIFLVRPLLGWAQRRDAENYCGRHQIIFRNDSMNDDLSFRRVRVRKVLLPIMKEFNPKIIETLAKTANLLRLESEKPENKFSPEESFDSQSSEVSLQKLKTLSQSAFYSFLREWMDCNRGDLRGLDLKHFEAVERLINSRKSGKIVELPDGDRIIKEKGKLLFFKKN